MDVICLGRALARITNIDARQRKIRDIQLLRHDDHPNTFRLRAPRQPSPRSRLAIATTLPKSRTYSALELDDAEACIGARLLVCHHVTENPQQIGQAEHVAHVHARRILVFVVVVGLVGAGGLREG